MVMREMFYFILLILMDNYFVMKKSRTSISQFIQLKMNSISHAYNINIFNNFNACWCQVLSNKVIYVNNNIQS
jgi:hypothetical protein